MIDRDLEDRVAEALEPVAMQCPDGRFDWDTWVVVGEYDVGRAARCQATVAAPEGDFEPGIFTAFKAVARGAAPLVGISGGVRPALTTYVSRAIDGDGSVPTWLAQYLFGCDTPEIVAVVRRAASWLERTRALLDVDDFDRYLVEARPQWDHPAGGVRLRATVDLVAEDDDRVVIVVPSLDEARLDQAGYQAVVRALGGRRRLGRAQILVHGTGTVHDLEAGEAADRCVLAARRAAEALLARPTGPDGLARRPSYFTCRDCAWAGDCTEKAAAEADDSGLRRGVRLPLSEA